MHNAPAVTYPVGRSRFQGQFIASLLVLGGLAGIGWWFAVDTPGWPQGSFWATWLLTGWIGLQTWWRTSPVVLAWDGQAWHCGDAEAGARGAGKSLEGSAACTVRLNLDLQFVMLLYVHSGGHSQWLWPERRTAPAAWLALRRAVIASATRTGAQADSASAALLKP